MSNKTISSNGFYKISELGAKIIKISDNIKVSLLDTGEFNCEIIIGENAQVTIYGVYINKINNITFTQLGENSKLQVRYVLAAKEAKLQTKIHSQIASNYSQSDLIIASFASKNGEIDIDGVIDLKKGFTDMKGDLIEENIFIGNSGKIRGLPTLLVASDQVEASHACKIEKISDEDLFYMRSRGIEKDYSITMYINSVIERTIGGLDILDSKLFKSLEEQLIKNIL